jgi:hypothetical protein
MDYHLVRNTALCGGFTDAYSQLDSFVGLVDDTSALLHLLLLDYLVLIIIGLGGVLA